MRTRSGKCKYGDLGLRSGRIKRVPKLCPTHPRGTAGAQRMITVVPFARTNNAGKIVSCAGMCWSHADTTRVNARTTVVSYLGSDWQKPPYDESKGAVLRLTLARSTCVMHVADLEITVGEMVAALNIATKAILGQTAEDAPTYFDIDSLDMDRYDRLAFKSSVLPNKVAIATYVKNDMYRIASPMLLHVLLRP